LSIPHLNNLNNGGCNHVGTIGEIHGLGIDIGCGYGWTIARDGTFLRAGSWETFAWVDPNREIVGIILTQNVGGRDPGIEFMNVVNSALLHWLAGNLEQRSSRWRRATVSARRSVSVRRWPWSEPRGAYESARSYQRSTRRARKVFHRLARPSRSSVSIGITPG